MIDDHEILKDIKMERYREYLKGLDEAQLIDTLKNVCLFKFETFMVDEILDADATGQYDDRFQDTL